MAKALVAFITAAALSTYLLRFSVAGIPLNLLDMFLAAASILLLVTAEKTTKQSPPKPVLISSLVLLIAAGIAVAMAPDKASALGIFKSWFVLPMLFAYGIWRAKIDPATLRSGLVLSGVIAAIYAIALFILKDTWVDYEGVERAVGFFSQPNYLALFLVPITVLTAASLREISGKSQRLNYLVSLVVMLVAVLLSYSKAGIVTLIICLPLVVLVQYSLKQFLMSMVIGIILFLGAYSTLPDFKKRFSSTLDTKSQTTSRVRVEITEASLAMVAAHPILGVGLGGYQEAYPTFRIENALEQDVLHPHNVYLAFWTQTGILGLLSFMFLSSMAFLQTLRSRSSEARAAALAGVSILLIGFFDTSYWKNDLSAVFWILVAMTVISHAKPSDAKA